MISEDDAKGFARKIVTYANGVKAEEEKVTLRTDVHFGYARNKGDARFHHAFHEDIISMYKTGKVKHAFAAWHDHEGKDQGAAGLQQLRERGGRQVGRG